MVSHAVAALLTAVAGNCLGCLVYSLCCRRFRFFFCETFIRGVLFATTKKKGFYSFSRPSLGSFALQLPVTCYLRVVTCDILESLKTQEKAHTYTL